MNGQWFPEHMHKSRDPQSYEVSSEITARFFKNLINLM